MNNCVKTVTCPCIYKLFTVFCLLKKKLSLSDTSVQQMLVLFPASTVGKTLALQVPTYMYKGQQVVANKSLLERLENAVTSECFYRFIYNTILNL